MIELALQDISPNTDEQFILVFPKGEFFIQHLGRKLNFDAGFFNRVIGNFNSEELSKPFIDKNHEMKESLGDIMHFDITDEGLRAKIQLNENGVAAVKNREYRYISPTFGNVKDNLGVEHKDVLLSVTLTNIPALQGSIPQLQDQLQLEIDLQNHKEKNMIKLASVLNLQDEASEESMIAAVQEIAGKLTEALELIASLTGEKDQAVEEKEVAEKVAEEMTAELEGIKAKDEETSKELFFKDAVESGKVHPSEVDKWKEHYSGNKDFVVNMLSARKGDKTTQLSTTTTEPVVNLSEEDKQAMINCNMDINNPEDVKLHLEAQEKY